MDKGIKGGKWSWMMSREPKDLSPKRNGFQGTETDFMESFL
jgi:hypothetical protein